MIEGSIWLLKVIFGGCIFLSFSAKIETFWSISQRNSKFVQICVFDHILCATVVFWYIFRSIFSKKTTKIETFWSILQRNRKFVQIFVSDHILGAKVIFWYIFRSIFSKKIVKFRVGNKNFEKLRNNRSFYDKPA